MAHRTRQQRISLMCARLEGRNLLNLSEDFFPLFHPQQQKRCLMLPTSHSHRLVASFFFLFSAGKPKRCCKMFTSEAKVDETKQSRCIVKFLKRFCCVAYEHSASNKLFGARAVDGETFVICCPFIKVIFFPLIH